MPSGRHGCLSPELLRCLPSLPGPGAHRGPDQESCSSVVVLSKAGPVLCQPQLTPVPVGQPPHHGGCVLESWSWAARHPRVPQVEGRVVGQRRGRAGDGMEGWKGGRKGRRWDEVYLSPPQGLHLPPCASSSPLAHPPTTTVGLGRGASPDTRTGAPSSGHIPRCPAQPRAPGCPPAMRQPRGARRLPGCSRSQPCTWAGDTHQGWHGTCTRQWEP